MMHPMMMVNPQGGPPMMHPYYGYPHPYNPMMVMVNPHTMSPMMQQNMMMGMQVGAFMCVGVWAGGGGVLQPHDGDGQPAHDEPRDAAEYDDGDAGVYGALRGACMGLWGCGRCVACKSELLPYLLASASPAPAPQGMAPHLAAHRCCRCSAVVG